MKNNVYVVLAVVHDTCCDFPTAKIVGVTSSLSKAEELALTVDKDMFNVEIKDEVVW